MDDNAHLNTLRAVLVERGWTAEVRPARGRTVLHVQHPEIPRLNDDIACQDGTFRWAWGQGIGSAAEMSEVADRIQHVLRGVGS